MDRRTDPRSPVQSVRTRWWPPFLLAFLAALGLWTWQQWQIQPDRPDEPKAPLTNHPKANLVALFSTDDYPAEAIRNGEQGTVAFKLSIDPNGRVGRCDVTSSSGSATLDAATCDILKARARFAPARNARGDRAPDEFSGRIRWELPEE